VDTVSRARYPWPGYQSDAPSTTTWKTVVFTFFSSQTTLYWLIPQFRSPLEHPSVINSGQCRRHSSGLSVYNRDALLNPVLLASQIWRRPTEFSYYVSYSKSITSNSISRTGICWL
jgi:hypothetical protein